MITEIFTDIFAAVGSVFSSAPLHVLVAIIAICVFAGLRINNLSAIFGWVFEATLLLGGFVYFWNWLSAGDRFTFSAWESQTIQSWNSMLSLSIEELFGYFALFFLLILVIHVFKRFVRG